MLGNSQYLKFHLIAFAVAIMPLGSLNAEDSARVDELKSRVSIGAIKDIGSTLDREASELISRFDLENSILARDIIVYGELRDTVAISPRRVRSGHRPKSPLQELFDSEDDVRRLISDSFLRPLARGDQEELPLLSLSRPIHRSWDKFRFRETNSTGHYKVVVPGMGRMPSVRFEMFFPELFDPQTEEKFRKADSHILRIANSFDPIVLPNEVLVLDFHKAGLFGKNVYERLNVVIVGEWIGGEFSLSSHYRISAYTYGRANSETWKTLAEAINGYAVLSSFTDSTQEFVAVDLDLIQRDVESQLRIGLARLVDGLLNQIN